jgi:hypothetical protein
MRPMKARPAPVVGEGVLSFSGSATPTDYVLHSNDKMKSGTGAIIGEPDRLRSAFRAGQVKLQLDDGKDLQVIVIAHSEGGDRAYFEITR